MRPSIILGLLKWKHCNDGSHFHLTLKLDGVLRWAGGESRITTTYGIVLNFQDVRLLSHLCVAKKDLLKLLSKSHRADIVSSQITQVNETHSTRAEKQEICNTPFAVPTKGTFNWFGKNNCECVFVNDFRQSKKIIPWSKLLNLLEGKPIQVPVPKCIMQRMLCGQRIHQVFSRTSK